MSQLRSIPRSTWSLPLLFLVALVAAVGVFAEVEQRSAETVTVRAGEVVEDDLYATGDVVRVEGTVRGDLVTAGREVVVAGSVEGDVIAAARLVRITGRVRDDVRIAGQVLHLGPEARIGDDLVSAGYSLEVEEGGSVGGTLVVAAYQARIAGAVEEGLQGGLAALEIAGPVGGDVAVGVGKAREEAPPTFWPMAAPVPSVRPGLTLAEGARIAGDLLYASPDAARRAPGAEVVGEVRHRQVAAAGEEAPSAVDRAVDGVRRASVLLLVGALLLLVAPRWTARLADTARSRPLPALGWGLVFLAAVVLAVLVIGLATAVLAVGLGVATLSGLAAAVVGTGLLAEAVLVLGTVVVAAYLTPVVVGLAGGRMAMDRSGEAGEGRRGRSFAALAVGVLVLVLLGLVPVLGAVISIAVLLLGLGALWLWGADRLRGRRAAEPAAGTP